LNEIEDLEKLLRDEGMFSRVKIENLILVNQRFRPSSQITIPAEIPKGKDLGAQIDRRLSPYLLEIKRVSNPRSKLAAINRAKKEMEKAFKDIVVSSEGYKALENWANKLDLKVKRMRVRPTVQELYLFKEKKIGEELNKLDKVRAKIRTNARRNPDPRKGYLQLAYPEEFNGEWLRRMGRLLGYPDCCSDRYAMDRERGINVEERASAQLKKEERKGEVDPHVYFVSYFFPCKPDCEEAFNKGIHFHDGLTKTGLGLGEVYEGIIKDNLNRVRNQPELIARYLSNANK
jgi:hypothetical protein